MNRRMGRSPNEQGTQASGEQDRVPGKNTQVRRACSGHAADPPGRGRLVEGRGGRGTRKGQPRSEGGGADAGVEETFRLLSTKRSKGSSE